MLKTRINNNNKNNKSTNINFNDKWLVYAALTSLQLQDSCHVTWSVPVLGNWQC